MRPPRGGGGFRGGRDGGFGGRGGGRGGGGFRGGGRFGGRGGGGFRDEGPPSEVVGSYLPSLLKSFMALCFCLSLCFFALRMFTVEVS